MHCDSPGTQPMNTVTGAFNIHASIEIMKTGALSNPLVLIVGVPLLFVLVVAIFANVPSMFMNAKYDFLYVQPGSRYYYSDSANYYIEAGKLKSRLDPGNLPALSGKSPLTTQDQNIENVRAMQLYLFDTETWSSRPVSLKEAQSYTYSALSISPDGYSIERSRSADGIFPFVFSYSNNGDFVMKKGVASRRLPIGSMYYNYDNGFIGWVIE